MTWRLRTSRPAGTTDSADSNQLWPGELIAQATDIIRDRFQLDGAQALAVLRRMSRETRTQMCAVAEQLINHPEADSWDSLSARDSSGSQHSSGLRDW